MEGKFETSSWKDHKRTVPPQVQALYNKTTDFLMQVASRLDEELKTLNTPDWTIDLSIDLAILSKEKDSEAGSS